MVLQVIYKKCSLRNVIQIVVLSNIQHSFYTYTGENKSKDEYSNLRIEGLEINSKYNHMYNSSLLNKKQYSNLTVHDKQLILFGLSISEAKGINKKLKLIGIELDFIISKK